MAGICGRIAWVVGRDLDYAYVLIHQYSLVHHVINQENHDHMSLALDDLAHYSTDRLFLHPILEFEFFRLAVVWRPLVTDCFLGVC